jgi:hypothetical protein
VGASNATEWLRADEPPAKSWHPKLGCYTQPAPDERQLLLAPSSQPASYHFDRPIQISGGVSQAEESGFELRWCKIDP